MKIQCSCGAKYAFDITPEMGQTPIRFVCQTCGLDSSEYVNALIRQQLTSTTTVEAPSAAATAVDTPSTGTSRLRIEVSRAAKPAEEEEAGTLPLCAKHPGQLTTHHCVVCRKPICPKCMEFFGYVCSPLCSAKAEAQGIEVPEYAGKKSTLEAREWRKAGLVGGVIAAVVAGLLGLWFWYAWIGSVPRPMFSVRFAEPAYAGQSMVCGSGQIVFLHGGTLARYDMRTKAEIWSRNLIDKKQIAAVVAQETGETQPLTTGPDNEKFAPRSIPERNLLESMEMSAEAALQLQVRGQNIWVAAPDKLVRYDWDTGKPAREIPLTSALGRWISQGDDWLLVEEGGPGLESVTHIDLTTGTTRVEPIGEPQKTAVANASPKKPGPGGGRMAGLPIGMPGKDAGKPLDPMKVAEQAQNLPLPAKIALPAVLAANLNQEQALAELNDDPPRRPSPTLPGLELGLADRVSFVPSPYGSFQFSVHLLESRITTRTAMKAPPAKSVLDANLTVTKTAEVANEILNEMQRSHGGGTVTEDESRYQVTVRRPGAKEVPDWTGEVIGPPRLFPLKTVTVVSAGKILVVLDKANKKLWQATLSYNVTASAGVLDEDVARGGQGPCVERGNTLYVFDAAVLTAFDLATGKARWRLPSIGVAGLFFDDQEMMYVNTTTAGPERLKYSRQIDVTQKTGGVVLKIDPRTGKTLWSTESAFISYVSGKFVYTLDSYQKPDGEEENPYAIGVETPSHLTIQRLNPDNGRLMWVHYQKRAPLDVRFNGNIIQLVFRKEVQVLKFLSF